MYACVPDVVSVLSSTKIDLSFKHRKQMNKNITTTTTCPFNKKKRNRTSYNVFFLDLSMRMNEIIDEVSNDI